MGTRVGTSGPDHHRVRAAAERLRGLEPGSWNDDLDDRTVGPSFYMPSPVVEFDGGRLRDQDRQRPFTNNGSEVLEVIQVKPTCGCTSTKLEKTRFEPGKGDTINLTFKPKGSGSQTKTVIVVTNDPRKPNHEIKIKADVIATLQATPDHCPSADPHRSGAKRTIMLQSGNPNFAMDEIRVYGDIKDHVRYELRDPAPPGPVRRVEARRRTGTFDGQGWYTGSLRINGKVVDPAEGNRIATPLTVNANLQNLLASVVIPDWCCPEPAVLEDGSDQQRGQRPLRGPGSDRPAKQAFGDVGTGQGDPNPRGTATTLATHKAAHR